MKSMRMFSNPSRRSSLSKCKSFWLVLSFFVFGSFSAWGQTQVAYANAGSMGSPIPVTGGGNVVHGGTSSTGTGCTTCTGASIDFTSSKPVTVNVTGGIYAIEIYLSSNNSTTGSRNVSYEYSSSNTFTGTATGTIAAPVVGTGKLTCDNLETYKTVIPAPANEEEWCKLTVNSNCRIIRIVVYKIDAGPTGPSLSATPTSYANCLTKNIASGGATSVESFLVNGSQLTSAVTATAPAGFEVSLSGTGGWAGSVTVPQTAGEITDVPVYVRIAASVATVQSLASANITISGGGVATNASVAVCGEVVNVSPLPCPTTMQVDNVTFAGAEFSWSNVANNNGYIIKVYNGAVEVQSNTVAKNATTYAISGLTELTAYTVRLTVKGDGTSGGDSPECAAQNFTTTKAPVSNKVTCLTEDFGFIVQAGNQSEAESPGNSALQSGSDRTKSGLVLESGLWDVTAARYITNSDAPFNGDIGVGSNGNAIFLRGANSTLVSPEFDNPKAISFYIKVLADNTVATNGFIIKVGSTTITTIKMDGVEKTADASERFHNVGNSAFTTGWHLVEAEVPVAMQTTSSGNNVTIQSGDGSNDRQSYYIDNFKVECSSTNLTAAPDAGGMNYVVDILI